MASDGLRADDDLAPSLRDYLAQFITPRRGLDGRRYWPIDEILINLDPADLPTDMVAATGLILADELATLRADEDECQAHDDEHDDLPAESAKLPPAEDVTLEVARRQQARLARSQDRGADRPRRPSRWSHVPLATLFEQAGNQLSERPNGSIETGHEPCHSSRSGRCVTIEPGLGLWWCRGCRQGGDALTLLQQLHGWTRSQATQYLTRQFGAPQRRGQQPEPKPRKILEA